MDDPPKWEDHYHKGKNDGKVGIAGRLRRSETAVPPPEPPTPGGETDTPVEDRLVEGAIMVTIKGDVKDGDAIFESATVALKGATQKTRDITFLPKNKEHAAAQRLLVHVVATGGRFDKKTIEGICNDAGLQVTMAGNVRNTLDKVICAAAGLATQGTGKSKAFSYDPGKKEYFTKLTFSIRSINNR